LPVYQSFSVRPVDRSPFRTSEQLDCLKAHAAGLQTDL
jgi:hypothetical protein